ncbi:MAG: hypothetical protein LCH56_14255 [Proteobacteria bacterium]|nr:hypothetical protein [Pseudomonadota bacterium]
MSAETLGSAASVEQRLREEANGGSSAAQRDLACLLYKKAGRDTAHASEAYKNMRAAADAGDDIARLYVSAYLRKGFGVARSGAAANAFIADLMDHIGRSSPSPLTSLADAAAALQAGVCAPPDEEGASELYSTRPRFTPLSYKP